MQTAEAQMHVPPPPYSAVVLPGESRGQFGIRVDGPPGVTVALYSQHVRLTLEDSSGHTIAGPERFRFDSCIPYPEMLRGSQPRYPDFWSGFKMNTTNLPAGMYRIVAHFNPGFATAHNKPVDLDERYGRSHVAVYLAPPMPTPTRHVGQQLIALTESPPIEDARPGRPTNPYFGQVLTIERIEADQVRLRVEGSNSSLALSDVSQTNLHGLYSLMDDSSVRYLRAKYMGHPVWGFGGILANNIRGWSGFGGWGPLTITGIYRAHGYLITIAIGSPNAWAVASDLPSGFLVLDPLVIEFKTPAVMTQLQGGIDQAPPQGTLLYWMLSDVWDFERSFSLTPMEKAHPEWSKSMIDDIHNGKVKLGMSKDAIAWMFGYPASYGTIDRVRTLEAWHYDQSTPFQYTVYFRGDRVVKYDPPGNLP